MSRSPHKGKSEPRHPQGSATADPSRVLDARAAAELLGVHVETLRRLARRGGVPAFKVGKDWRFDRAALQRWTQTEAVPARVTTVLLIDDDRLVLKAMRRVLERQGCRVLTALDGLQGLAQVRSESPDLVLLDLQMPAMSGPEFLRELRRTRPEMPVIIVTGYPDSKLMQQAIPYGPLMLLEKPASPSQLEGAVRMALGEAATLATET
ncbi:MAG: response regulator [Pseudomonadota bacterium]